MRGGKGDGGGVVTTAQESELSRKAMLTRRAYSLELEKIEIWRKLWKEIGEEGILTRGCLVNIMEKDVWKVQGKEENVKTSAVEGFAGDGDGTRPLPINPSLVAHFLRGIFSDQLFIITYYHHHYSFPSFVVSIYVISMGWPRW